MKKPECGHFKEPLTRESYENISIEEGITRVRKLTKGNG